MLIAFISELDTKFVSLRQILFVFGCQPFSSYHLFANFDCKQETEMEIEEEVDNLMSNDIMSAVMSTKTITFTRAQSGWIFKEDKHVRGLTSLSCGALKGSWKGTS